MAKKASLNLEHIVFLDIEASSLGSDSFPIEVGWAFVCSPFASFLIRPSSNWSFDAWEPTAETVHRIRYEQFHENGISAWDASRRLNALLARESVRLTVISDPAEMDSFWLDRLFEESPDKRRFRSMHHRWQPGSISYQYSRRKCPAPRWGL